MSSACLLGDLCLIDCMHCFSTRAVDLSKLTSSVHVLELENAELRTRNKKLEKEVIIDP